MCVLTFIAYFLGKCVMLFVNSRHIPINRPLKPYRLAIYTSFGTFDFINRNINILFYCLFMIKFKVLLIKKLQNIRQNFKSEKPFSSSPKPILPDGQTLTSSRDWDETIIHDESEGVTDSRLPSCCLENPADETQSQSSAAGEPLKEEPLSPETCV